MTAHDNGRANSGDAAGLNVAIIQMNSQDDKRRTSPRPSI